MTLQLRCDTAGWASRTLSDISERTAQSSLEAVATLTSLCIENIYFLRKIVPERYFTSYSIDGVDVKKFKEINEAAIVNANHWITSTLDALRKGYLSTLAMTVYAESQPNNGLEAYKINFKYNEESDPTGLADRQLQEGIKNFIVEMKNVLINKLKPLPTSECIVVDFSIIIQGAPNNYTPLHFERTANSKNYVMDSQMKQETVSIMNASYHALRLKAKGFFENSDKEIINLDDTPTVVISDNEEPILEGTQQENRTSGRISKRKRVLAPNTPNKGARRRLSVSTFYANETQATDDESAGSLLNCSLESEYFTDVENSSPPDTNQSVVSQQFVAIGDERKISGSQDTSSIKKGNITIDCICKTNIHVFLSLIKCNYCFKYAHAECYATKNVDLLYDKYCCVQCALMLCNETNKIKCTDPRLLRYTRDEQQVIALLRLAAIMKRRGDLSVNELKTYFADAEYNFIFNRFKMLRIIYKSADKIYQFNMAKLKNFCRLHFKGKKSSNVNLLENSQRNQTFF